MPIAVKLASGSPFAGFVPMNDESVRSVMLRCLVGGAGVGAVFVSEAMVRMTAPGREMESELVITAALMGEMRPVWHSRQPVAEVIGWFAASDAEASALRDAFRKWAKATQHATCALVGGAVEKL